MAQSTIISTKELQRQAALCFEGKTIKVLLANIGATGYNSESTVANWQSVEVTGLGYVRFSQVIATGSYSNTAAAYVIPNIDAQFTAGGSGWGFDRIVIYIDGETYPHSIISENPSIYLQAGQTQTYRLSLRQDD
jgi:hypothetical protein